MTIETQASADVDQGEDETTEVTLAYCHPEQEFWEQPITYTRTVRVAELHRILAAIDDAEA